MSTEKVMAFLENIFDGGGGYPEEGPESLNKRFNWVDPKTGRQPPKPPKDALPNKDTFDYIERNYYVPTAHVEPENVEDFEEFDVPMRDMTDKVGRHSINSLIPNGELATIDQLLDLKLRAQKAKGQEATALNKEFNAHRSEFESMVNRIVDVIIEGAYERSFNKSVSGIRTGVDKVDQKLNGMFKELPVGTHGASFKPQEPEDYYDQHSKLVQADRRSNRAAGRYPGNPRRAAAAKRAAQRLTGHENRFGE